PSRRGADESRGPEYAPNVAISRSESARAHRVEPLGLTTDIRAPSPDQRRGALSIVVPLLNEAATLEPLYREIKAGLAATGIEWEVVFVDDGSTDGSYRELVRLHAAHLNVRVVRL